MGALRKFTSVGTLGAVSYSSPKEKQANAAARSSKTDKKLAKAQAKLLKAQAEAIKKGLIQGE